MIKWNNAVTKPKILPQTPVPPEQIGLSYQEKLAGSFDERWSIMSTEFPSTGSLLDIGSNLGDFTARAAQAGFWSIGVESDVRLLDRAVQRHKSVPRCAFMLASLDQADIAKLPRFDVVLLLSVHHHWHYDFGPGAAESMLRGLMAKANDVLIFESTSRNERFRADAPGFADNDERSITAYYGEYLNRTVGEMASVTLLGKAPCVGEREPYRWIYAIRPFR